MLAPQPIGVSRRTALLGSLLFLTAIAAILLVTQQRKPQPATPRSPASACVDLRAQLERLSCPGTIANDWGALSYYRDDDARLAQQATAPQLTRVVFIGDSITYSWPALRAGGNLKNIEGVNRGITSQVTAQMLLRFRQDVIDLHPRVVVILAGSNDLAYLLPPAAPIIESNLASMAELAGANGIRVVLSSIPPVSDYELDVDGKPALRTATHSPQQIVEVNAWMKNFAAKRDFVFLDYYSSLVDEKGFFKKGYSLDGLHPNDKGYAVMEELLNEALGAAIR